MKNRALCFLDDTHRAAFFGFAVNSLRNRVIEYLEANGSITSVAAAEQLGATRPSLSRVLSKMASEGLQLQKYMFLIGFDRF